MLFRRLLISHASKTITSAAVVVGGMSLVSRALGLLRDRVLAGEFGADAVLDTYYAAFRIPDFIFNLLVVGALSAGFIPVFSSLYDGDGSPGRRSSWRLVSNIFNVVGLAILALSAVVYVWSAPITRVMTPGFTPAQVEQTVGLSRIMLWSPLLLGMSAVVGGVLQSRKQFFIYSLAPILYNVGIICGALFFVPRWGVSGLAWGVVLGAGLHLLIQLPAMVAAGFHYRPVLDFRDAELKTMLRLMGPRTLSLAISQLNLVVVTLLASWLSAGSLAIYTFANNLQSFPLGIFGIPFAIAAFPTLSALAPHRERFLAALSQTLRHILFLVIPASVLLILLRAQVVRALLGSGRFDWNDTVDTMQTLAIFSGSLFAQAVIPLLIRAFYAQRDSVTPLLTAIGSVLLNVALAFALLRPLGIAGLALSWTVANVLQLAVLWLLLRLRLGSLNEREVFSSSGKIMVAVSAMAIVTQGLKYAVAPLTGTETFVGVMGQGSLAALAGIGTYVAVSLGLRSPEAQALAEWIFRRRRNGATVPEVVSDGTTAA